MPLYIIYTGVCEKTIIFREKLECLSICFIFQNTYIEVAGEFPVQPTEERKKCHNNSEAVKPKKIC